MSKKNSNVLKHKNYLIKESKISEIYNNFEFKLKRSIKKKPFLVAVSGGSDSLALTALSYYFKKNEGNKIFYVHIDHGLRSNSSKEAKKLKELLKKNKINLRIIRNKKKILKNIQSQAREIRYRLLVDFCKKYNINFILTGHHSDDQIETFLIRLSRGSGVQGLASMSSITYLDKKIKLFRPLLDLEKKQLIYTAKKFFVKIFKDPSNLDTKYLRTKIRFLKKELEKNGIKSNQILKSINNLASTRDTLNNYLNQTIKKCFKKKNKKILVALKPLFLETKEIQLKALSKIIKTFSGSYYPPRSKKVINLINNIKLSQKNKFTLGGCIFEKDRNNMIITLEV